ncbi:methyltransferase family protein [Gemmatimonadota bacterium]
MQVIVIQAFGVLIFLVGSIRLASTLRRLGNSRVAENASRISHGLFWLTLVLPGTIGLFYPGLTAYDELFGMPSLPVPPIWIAIGVVLLTVGLVLLVSSNRFLIKKGRGAAAFLLTGQLVTDGLYGRTRNPMSLGFYAACVGIGMIAGSLTVTLGVLLIIVPVHVINLKHFEERELEQRYGDSYVDYRQRVPFLIPRFKRI